LGIYLALINRIFFYSSKSQHRLVWGATPIISYSYWARAMAECGYTSQTFTNSYYATINRREDWDLLIQERYGKHVPLTVKFLLAFFESLFKYDVFLSHSMVFFLASLLTGGWKVFY
jgi:hypothetical protein